MNEAELQANFKKTISRALPALGADFELEHYLHLKLGHSEVTINGRNVAKSLVKGRYDMIVKRGDQPLLVVELKEPDLTLSDDDAAQGLSYARVHVPPVPLVLITNSVETRLLRAYDGQELDNSDPAATLLGQVTRAAAIAAQDVDNAVRVLLTASSEPWQQLLDKWTAQQVAALIGEARDFGSPIAKGFEVPREVVQTLIEALEAEQRVLVLHAPPLAGITNTLAQLGRATAGRWPTLLVDTHAVPDVLQHLANLLSHGLSYPISKDELRGWLNRKGATAELVLLLDGLPKHELLQELLYFAEQGALRLVIGASTDVFNEASSLTHVARPQKTLLGRLAAGYALPPFSDDEFAEAQRVFYETGRAAFLRGAQHNSELRQPRALRVRAAGIPHNALDEASPNLGRVLGLNPITGIQELLELGQLFAPAPSQQVIIERLAEAYLAELATHQSDSDWLAATWGYPSISADTARRYLNAEATTWLEQAGLASWKQRPKLRSRLVVRHDELLAHAVATRWAEELTAFGTEQEQTAYLTRVLPLLHVVPTGELALALAIMKAAASTEEVLQNALAFFLARPPVESRLTDGTQIRLLTKDDATIDIRFGEGMDEPVWGNTAPWLILSYLAALPMAGGIGERSPNFSILTEVASAPEPILSLRATILAETTSLHLHEVEGGSLLCWNDGIVEPVLQALVIHLRDEPQEFDALVQWSVDQRSPYLGWRLLAAASTLTFNTNPEVKQAAEAAEKRLKDQFGFGALHADEADAKQTEQLE